MKKIDEKISSFIALIGAVDKHKMATFIVGAMALIVYLFWMIQSERKFFEQTRISDRVDFKNSLMTANHIIAEDRKSCDSIRNKENEWKLKYILSLEKRNKR